MTQSTPPGWYPDGQGNQRWWDGHRWTDHVQPAPGSSDRPTASEPPAQPDPADVTRVRPPEQPAGDRPAPAAGAEDVAAASAPTQVAGGAQPGQPGQPGAPTYPGQPVQPGQPAWQGQQYGGGSGGGGVNTRLILIIGGAAAAVLVLVVVLAVVLGGGGSSPTDVVEDFLDSDSCSEAEDLVSEDFIDRNGECSEEELDALFGDDSDFDLEVTDEEVDGDEATVEVEVTGEFEGQEISETTTFSLVKEDGDWKIDDIA